MSRAPNWSPEEFETLLQNQQLSDTQLSRLLPIRTVHAIGWVRNGVHSYHEGGNISMLSKMMIHRLEQGNGKIICPRCSVTI